LDSLHPTGLNILNRKDALVICDGYPPRSVPSSWPHLADKCRLSNVIPPIGSKRVLFAHYTFLHGPEEIVTAAKEAYNLDKIELELRYTKYGGVARSIYYSIFAVRMILATNGLSLVMFCTL